MKRFFKVINIIAAITYFVFAMALDSDSNIPITICAITSGWLFIYLCGKDIAIAVIDYIVAAFKED